MKAKVVISESHHLMQEQIKILNNMFAQNWERFDVPSQGWTLSEQEIKVRELLKEQDVIIFASPIPAMIKMCVRQSARANNVLIFHNDNRDKKELPNGRIIMVVAKEGWQLV